MVGDTDSTLLKSGCREVFRRLEQCSETRSPHRDDGPQRVEPGEHAGEVFVECRPREAAERDHQLGEHHECAPLRGNCPQLIFHHEAVETGHTAGKVLIDLNSGL